MKNLLLILFLAISQVGICQNDVPLIEREGNLVSNRYFILGQEVSERQVLRMMKPFEVSHKRMKSSRRWAFTSSIVAGFGVGAFMPTFFDPTPEVTLPLLITGVSLIAIAVPLKKLANRKADEAIELYNSRKLLGEKRYKPEFNLTFAPSGIGLNMIF
ncbi:hypothetical protein SAMN05661096_02637 [Marivirga sericea]|uniref:Uncharacterized protein n=1 Tax=Marivirga sericea TaxID=1028 RepID=A0A1X7KF29_9BACT|nr:hypothetical protein [Marivirga sericea]SMG39494.1 hypothetical protein SAMN05661096_02637 [Marivirga sericea]